MVVETAGDALGGLGNGNGGIFTGTLLTDRGRRPQDAMKVTEHIAAYHDSALVLNPTPFRLL